MIETITPAPAARLTSAQRRPFVVRFRNAIHPASVEGRRFRTEADALAFAKDPANWTYNNCRVWVGYDLRDGSTPREIWESMWYAKPGDMD
jgi:hypothetical protein